MKEIWLITITSTNNDETKSYSETIECKNLTEVVRLILTYKPKHGYKPVVFQSKRSIKLL